MYLLCILDGCAVVCIDEDATVAETCQMKLYMYVRVFSLLSYAKYQENIIYARSNKME